MTFVIQENQDPTEIAVLKNNISLFDTSKDTQNVKYTIYNAFPLERTGKNGTVYKVKNQILAGSEIPTVLTGNLTNANVLKPVTLEQQLIHKAMVLELEISNSQVEDGLIDRQQAILDMQSIMQRIILSVLLKGQAVDNKTGHTMFMNENSLLNIATPYKSNVDFETGTSTEISKELDSMIDNTSNAGAEANTIIISKKAFRKMTLSGGTSLESEKVMSYIASNGLTVYPTEILDKAGKVMLDGKLVDAGAVAIFFKNEEKVLKGIIGKEAELQDKDNNNFTSKPCIGGSIAGFVKNNKHKDSVVVLTNLLG